MLQRVQRSAITKGVLNLYLNHLSRFLTLRQVTKTIQDRPARTQSTMERNDAPQVRSCRNHTE